MSYDRDKSKEQLITELERLRLENAELKKSNNNQREHLPIKEEDVQQKSWINFLSSRILLDSMQEVIAIKDLNGVHRASSSAMCDLIGKSESYIVGCTDFDLFPHEQATFYVEIDREVIEAQESKKIEEQVTGQHGTSWVQTTKSPLFDHSGECIGIIVVVRDISERKNVEEELQRYRYLLDKSQEIAHLGSWELELSSGRLTWSDETYRIFGLKPQEAEITYETFFKYVYPEDRDAVDSAYMDSIRMNKDTDEIEHRIIRESDGVVRTVFVKYYHIRDNFENIVKSAGMIQDITEQKQKEEEIKKREEELQAIFNTVKSGIILVDKGGHIIQTNKAMTEMLQYDYEDIIGSKYIDHVYESETETAHTKMRQLMDRKLDSVHLERLYQRSDGTTFWGTLSGRRLYYPDGSFWGLVGAITDITERKKLEERLKEMSIYDTLTGLYSRNFFEEEMRRLGDARYLPLGIVSCDINGLKLINDTLGHDMGDEMLKIAAEILSRCFRASDIIARIGGDEFAVLLPQASEEILNSCTNRIRQEVTHYNEQGPDFGLSLAIGCAEVETTPMDVQAQFKRADDDMYKDKLQKSRSSRNETVQALLKTLEERDYITEGHAGRLDDYTHQLGRLAGISEERLKDLQLLSRFHDLGKVGVPDRILFKPGPLTAEEFEEMKRHCEIGNRIALFTSDLSPIADYILKHHEHWDGRGYPLGLAGKEIPLECRILAVVDAYDTMTHERPYKGAMSHKDAIEELKRCAGTQFDPELVEQFIQILEQYDTE